mgnify:CR=1 FL=1
MSTESNFVRLVKTVNFGSGKASLSNVGFRLMNLDGSISGSRSTSTVGEVLVGAGIYSASIYFTNTFSGSILWDTGESTPSYASEDYNGIQNKIELTRQLTSGRWKVDNSSKEMIFYKEDNTTEIARYELFDESGSPSVSSVFDRRKKS